MPLELPKKLGYTQALRGAKKWALLFGAYSCLPSLSAYFEWFELPGIPGSASAALSFALALLIGFRINQAYDRWWEARKLWGSLVNVSRNLAVKIRALHQPGAADRESIRNLIVAFCVGLKDHLRDEARLKGLPGFANDDASPGHLPSFIVTRLYGTFDRWRAEGKLTDQQLWVLDVEAREFLEVCGACERIKNTMVSISWRTFTRQCIVASLLLLPWGLVEDFGVWTVLLTVLISYFVIAGEAIARYVETPFGRDEDHLDLEQICGAIDRSVSEVLKVVNEEDR
jgi:putative membrane protein